MLFTTDQKANSVSTKTLYWSSVFTRLRVVDSSSHRDSTEKEIRESAKDQLSVDVSKFFCH